MSDTRETHPSVGSFLGRLRDDAKTFREMMRDFRSRAYPTVPMWSIASILVAIVYVVSPADLISDWIPVLGQLDDAGVVSLAWMLVRRDLAEYRRWRATRDLGDEIPNE